MKKLLPVLFFLFLVQSVSAQNWIGLSNSNMAGTNGIYMNPSSIADGQLGGYINFFGIGANVYNNYISYSGKTSLARAMFSKDTSNSVKDNNLVENLNGKDKVINFSTEIRGPSFMISVGKKSAIALTTRSRTFVQAVDVSQPIARMIRWGFSKDQPAFGGGPDGLSYEQLYNRAQFGINVNTFAEVGFTYATVLMDEKNHFLKAGATYKYIAGLYSFYFKNGGNGGVIVHSDDSITLSNTNISYGYLNEGYFRNDTNKFGNVNMGGLFGPDRVGNGYGLDLGLMYEYRPNYKKYKYQLDGKERWNREENKYLFKVGATLMDVGRIRYYNSKYVRNNTVTKNVVHWGQIDTLKQVFDGFDSLGKDESVFTRFDKDIEKVMGFDNQSNELIAKLPTALNIQVDFKITRHWYVNVTWLQGLRKKGAIGMRQFSMLSAVPRYEARWFEAALPLVINNDYRNFTVGAMLRFGPFYMGSDNLAGIVKSKNVYGFDFYTGLCLPLYKRNPRDRDHDGVSDKRDRCRTVPGKWDFSGCPDRDNDEVEDAKDQCPDVAGKPQFSGCPDTDNDGTPDSKDECIDIPGEPSFNGCPDTDDDGVEDRLDSCKFLKGLVEYNGCPDTDEDGVPDLLDDCPETKGIKELNGCPDADGDGVRDREDKCPDVAGPAEYRGCPDTDRDSIPDNVDKCPEIFGAREFGGCPDTDGDGVPDHKDLCALEPGLPENNGCPVVAEKIEIIDLGEEEEKILKEAFDNLEFETAKSVIQPESFKSLDELVELLKAKPDYKIYIAGHTDNQGNKKANQKLSENRADAVKVYLVSRGIDALRIKTEGFGDKRPIATNTTPAGRQKNRRVEFKIIK